MEGNEMKYVKQLLLILTICFIGELCRYFIPLPVPASIYGLVLMLLCLVTRIIKLEQVDETASFLVNIMPVMFIPAGVGLIDSYTALQPHLTAIVFITLATTLIVIGITGFTAQAVLKLKQSGRKEEANDE